MSKRQKQLGYAIWTSVDGPIKEADTFTCGHCNTVVFIHPIEGIKHDAGGFCRVCMKNICGPCADAGRCFPFEKKMEIMERRQKMLNFILGQ